MRTRTVVEIAIVWVLVAAFLVGYLAGGSIQVAAPSATTPTLVGSPTHYGHTMIGAGTGALSGELAPALSCPLADGNNCLGSYNWGGYIVYNSSFAVSKVVGSWTVPTITGSNAVTCPDAQTTWDSNAQWIGIDGAFTPTVEQTGTSADCFYGYTDYYAWYEFYPAGSVVSSNVVNPGDQITASVTYVGLNLTGIPLFETTLKDTTQGWSFSSPATPVPGALRASAEWIDESPYYDGFLGLTKVSQVTFSGGAATIHGVTRDIGNWGEYNVYWAVMVDYEFPYDQIINFVKGEPLALFSGGAGFKFDWISNGP